MKLDLYYSFSSSPVCHLFKRRPLNSQPNHNNNTEKIQPTTGMPKALVLYYPVYGIVHTKISLAVYISICITVRVVRGEAAAGYNETISVECVIK